MNFEAEIKQLQSQLTNLRLAIDSIAMRHASAIKFTSEFLEECRKTGLKKVGIQRLPKERKTFPFGAHGSVFGVGNVRDKFGWPAIWGVVSTLKISGGCGNSDQHQADCSNLIDGIYELKNGSWRRRENDD